MRTSFVCSACTTIVLALALATGLGAAESIRIDGSSTVYPITAAIAGKYREKHPDVQIEVAFSGSSSGFRKLIAGEIPMSGASRPIKAAEIEKAKDRGFAVIELPVAYDGITAVVNRDNSFVDRLSVEELRRIWSAGSDITNWSQVREGFPDVPLKLFGPGSDSGTFEYFTEAIIGKEGASRSDYVASEDDIDLVQGVLANPGALAYFGYSYYKENDTMMRPVPIGEQGRAVTPTDGTILDQSYQPLSRPLFIYINANRLDEVREFVAFYLDNAPKIVPQVGYVPLSDRSYGLARARLGEATTGSLFSGLKRRASVEEVLTGKVASPSSMEADTSDGFKVDGSSTVYPISAAIAANFKEQHPDADISVAFSGSSSGFRKLIAGEIPMSGASRPIKAKELDQAKDRGFEVIELPVAYDGITVVVNRDNAWARNLSVAELKAIWETGSGITNWSQIREGFPDLPLKLYGPGSDSGTFEYFTKSICGKEGASRTDYVASEDDIDLVQGIIANRGALGYFGYAYFKENETMMRPVAIGEVNNAVLPTDRTIEDGSYTPLSRPIFVYVNRKALNQNRLLGSYIDHYLTVAPEMVPTVGYVPLSTKAYGLVRRRLAEQRTGSLFSGLKGRFSVVDVLTGKATTEPAAVAAAKPEQAATPTPSPKPMPASGHVEAVEDLRDASLRFARRSLDDNATVAEMQALLKVLEAHLGSIERAGGATARLGGSR